MVRQVGHHDDWIQGHLRAIYWWWRSSATGQRVGCNGRDGASSVANNAVPLIFAGLAAVEKAAQDGKRQEDSDEQEDPGGLIPALGVRLPGASFAEMVASAVPDGGEEKYNADAGKDDAEILVTGGSFAITVVAFYVEMLKKNAGDAVKGDTWRDRCVRW